MLICHYALEVVPCVKLPTTLVNTFLENFPFSHVAAIERDERDVFIGCASFLRTLLIAQNGHSFILAEGVEQRRVGLRRANKPEMHSINNLPAAKWVQKVYAAPRQGAGCCCCCCSSASSSTGCVGLSFRAFNQKLAPKWQTSCCWPSLCKLLEL